MQLLTIPAGSKSRKRSVTVHLALDGEARSLCRRVMAHRHWQLVADTPDNRERYLLDTGKHLCYMCECARDRYTLNAIRGG